MTVRTDIRFGSKHLYSYCDSKFQQRLTSYQTNPLNAITPAQILLHQLKFAIHFVLSNNTNTSHIFHNEFLFADKFLISSLIGQTYKTYQIIYNKIINYERVGNSIMHDWLHPTNSIGTSVQITDHSETPIMNSLERLTSTPFYSKQQRGYETSKLINPTYLQQ